MFIRKVLIPGGSGTTQNVYYNLVESIRTESGPRQRLILNLGKLDIDPSQFKALANRIEDLLVGRQLLFDEEPQIEKLARQYADKIFSSKAKSTNESMQKKIRDFQSVDVNSLETKKVKSLGPEHVCHEAWKSLGMDKFLLEKRFKKTLLPIAEALVVGRLINPGSERSTKRWADEHSGIFELCGNPGVQSLNAWYRAADALYACKSPLEKYLARRECDLFELDESIVLYDLTNTYFEGQCSRNPSAKYGRSKEKRYDCKLATMGMVVDADGFPKYSKFHPGNQSEPKTFQDMILELEAGAGIQQKATVVMDAGIATKENIEWLKERKNSYIVGHRGSKPAELANCDDMQLIREDMTNGVKIEVYGKDVVDERFILVKSELKKRKEESMASRTEALLIERLEYLKDGLEKKGRMKSYSSILTNIGRLMEKYPRAAKLYNIEVCPGEMDKRTGKLIAKDIRWEKKPDKSKDAKDDQGTYILRTNRIDLTNERIWEIYIMLGRIEKSFRDIKSHLGFRPNFHQTEERVESHMFISVLAYHLMHYIEQKLRIHGDTRNWNTIKSVLATHYRLSVDYVSLNESNGLVQNTLRMDSQPSPAQIEIYDKLGISRTVLKRKFMDRIICSDKRKKQVSLLE